MDCRVVVLLAALGSALGLLYLFLATLQLDAEQFGSNV